MVMYMVDRRVYENNVYSHSIDIDWATLRQLRNNELMNTDWRAVSDRTISQDWIDYRTALRDLPQNFESANDAADNWPQPPE